MVLGGCGKKKAKAVCYIGCQHRKNSGVTTETGANLKLVMDYDQWQRDGLGLISIETDCVICSHEANGVPDDIEIENAFLEHEADMDELETDMEAQEELLLVERKKKLLIKTKNRIVASFRLKLEEKLNGIDNHQFHEYAFEMSNEEKNLLIKINQMFSDELAKPQADEDDSSGDSSGDGSHSPVQSPVVLPVKAPPAKRAQKKKALEEVHNNITEKKDSVESPAKKSRRPSKMSVAVTSDQSGSSGSETGDEFSSENAIIKKSRKSAAQSTFKKITRSTSCVFKTMLAIKKAAEEQAGAFK